MEIQFICTLLLMAVCSIQRLNANRGPDSDVCTLSAVYRFDCHPERFVIKDTCLSRGCCWTDRDTYNKKNSELTRGQPQCYYPSNFPGYTVNNMTAISLGYQVDLAKNFSAYYPKDVKVLKMDVMFETNSRLHVKVAFSLNK